MMTFPELIRPIDWLGFINPKEGRATGIQGAHLFGANLWGNGGPLRNYGDTLLNPLTLP